MLRQTLIHLGVLLVVAGVLAVVMLAVAPGRPFWQQAAAVALAAACASTRFFVQGYDAVGYMPVGVCLGLGFVAAVAVEDGRTRNRMVGGLMALLFPIVRGVVTERRTAWLDAAGRRSGLRIPPLWQCRSLNA